MPSATTALEAASAKPRATTYRLSFGDGLLLEVSPSGAKRWLYRFMLSGKRRDMGLGPFPAVGLADARRRAEEAGRQASDGTDPIEAREAARAAREAAERAAREAEQQRAATTFRAIAERLFAVQSAGWTSDKTAASWRLTLEKHAYPLLGSTPIADVGREHVIRALSPIWTTQPATARKLQRRIAAILDFAAANGWRAADNPAAGRVLRLTQALPKLNANGRRWPALAWQRVPAFLAALSKQEGSAPLALRLAILTGLRSNEVRQARWSEFDFAEGIWTLPGRRMKGGRAKELPPHRVPITEPMRDVLTRAIGLRSGSLADANGRHDLGKRAALLGDSLVFPTGAASDRALSDAALGACIKRLNEVADVRARARASAPIWHDEDGRPITAHGFRRSFRTWVDDERPQDAAAAEKQLAHEERNKVTAAYRGSDLLSRRRDLMHAWGQFCLSTPGQAQRSARRGGTKRSSNVP